MQDLCEERQSIVGVDEGGQRAVVDVASSEECKRVTSDALSEVVELQKKLERESLKGLKYPPLGGCV